MTDLKLQELRAFDLEGARAGHEVFLMKPFARFTYVAGPDSDNNVCGWTPDRKLCLCDTSQLRMAPICWVDHKPVYLGSTLYITARPDGLPFIVQGHEQKFLEGTLLSGVLAYSQERVSDLPLSSLAWQPPDTED